MEEAEKRSRIAEAAAKDICPECGKPLTDRVGTGSLVDGVFCSLNCQATFHHEYYLARARASELRDN